MRQPRYWKNAAPFPRPDYLFADIVGTGGDGSNSINISTASAFVAAACGLKVAKHGNRSVSSKSGSSDLLAAFGINLDMNADKSRQALDDLGVCFLFAPKYHTGFRHAMPVRQQLKTRTLFNVLGPLINPAHPPLALIGVLQPGAGAADCRNAARARISAGSRSAQWWHGRSFAACTDHCGRAARWGNQELSTDGRRLWPDALPPGTAGWRHAGRKP
ncbi:Anthranilate synthase, amidotransferase component / Anthranilate phosphoribosyltransferase [Citrobacter freundii]|uniref:Anthranilate synthase, amidotransferase component / Anthranilate phosphoribosyltransferase n=1 Tax=Citrobacter freundii TaxID=546 RepID=A0A7G2ITG9_CITFR|nr:Anthranilate synthase, amidotransferase component / Anthranilate phosphoribosyltransferase [Citrobacter freundii]